MLKVSAVMLITERERDGGGGVVGVACSDVSAKCPHLTYDA